MVGKFAASMLFDGGVGTASVAAPTPSPAYLVLTPSPSLATSLSHVPFHSSSALFSPRASLFPFLPLFPDLSHIFPEISHIFPSPPTIPHAASSLTLPRLSWPSPFFSMVSLHLVYGVVSSTSSSMGERDRNQNGHRWWSSLLRSPNHRRVS